MEEASLFSSGMEMTVEEEGASRPRPEEEARSKLASEAAAGGVVAFSLDDVVASSSPTEGHEGVDSSILLKRSFSALRAICLLRSASSAFVPGRLTVQVIEPDGAAKLYR